MCWTKLHNNIFGDLNFFTGKFTSRIQRMAIITNQFRPFVEGERKENDLEDYGVITLLAEFKFISQFVERYIV